MVRVLRQFVAEIRDEEGMLGGEGRETERRGREREAGHELRGRGRGE